MKKSATNSIIPRRVDTPLIKVTPINQQFEYVDTDSLFMVIHSYQVVERIAKFDGIMISLNARYFNCGLICVIIDQVLLRPFDWYIRPVFIQHAVLKSHVWLLLKLRSTLASGSTWALPRYWRGRYFYLRWNFLQFDHKLAIQSLPDHNFANTLWTHILLYTSWLPKPEF